MVDIDHRDQAQEEKIIATNCRDILMNQTCCFNCVNMIPGNKWCLKFDTKPLGTSLYPHSFKGCPHLTIGVSQWRKECCST